MMQLGAVGVVLFVISYHTAAQRKDCHIPGGERVTSVNISWLKLVCDSPSEIIASFDRLRLRLRLVPPSQPQSGPNPEVSVSADHRGCPGNGT